jgi:glycosyltransferase involved in cell wall biosynthesis
MPGDLAAAPRADVLVCVPCYNAQATVADCVRPFVDRDDTRILLVDDHSTPPLRGLFAEQEEQFWSVVTVVRPEVKVYAEGARNVGIRTALEGDYRLLVFVDSDIIAGHDFLDQVRSFFRSHPEQVLVSATIEPFGRSWQYAETLINFSRYLPRSKPLVGRTRHLASYACALNLDRFRAHPCFFDESHDEQGVWWSAEDIRFFDTVKARFQTDEFPILNYVSVEHRHPRSDWRRALRSQERYARAMLRTGYARYGMANALPLLHLLTPRFWLMVGRLIRRARVRDLRYAPMCWLLDFYRATQAIRLLWRHRRTDFER